MASFGSVPVTISRIYTGGCQCGAVRYRAEGTLDELRAQAGQGESSLEDTFLTLVAEQQQAA